MKTILLTLALFLTSCYGTYYISDAEYSDLREEHPDIFTTTTPDEYVYQTGRRAFPDQDVEDWSDAGYTGGERVQRPKVDTSPNGWNELIVKDINFKIQVLETIKGIKLDPKNAITEAENSKEVETEEETTEEVEADLASGQGGLCYPEPDGTPRKVLISLYQVSLILMLHFYDCLITGNPEKKVF